MSERWTTEDDKRLIIEMSNKFRNDLARENERSRERMEDFFEKLKAVLTLIAVVVLIILVIIYC